MTRWLLAAEADKIQDLIFRSSRLAEVAGGSSLLTRFCREVPALLITHHTGRRPDPDDPDDPDIVIADGGSFRLTFAEAEATLARRVGEDLAEAYYRATGGSLTVAGPQCYEEGRQYVAQELDLPADAPKSFRAAQKKAAGELRTRKVDRRSQAAALAHFPYVALCASCGVTLATRHEARHRDQRPNYLCDACFHKAAERTMVWAAPSEERFLSRFLQALRRAGADGVEPRVEAVTDQSARDLFPRDADQVGKYDPRRYVAYLVADGNDMGLLFDRCGERPDLRRLSLDLTAAMWGALAQVTVGLRWQLGRAETDILPVLPLIVGGDDLFALLPAPYALDAARQVCLAFEEALRPWADALGAPRPTMAAAVVICKSNYPYALAHRRGEALLERTKRLLRAARLEGQINASAVDFAIVRGDEPAADEVEGQTPYFVPTLCPYWAGGDLPTGAEDYALELGRLLESRRLLHDLPGKRRAELRELFADLPTQGDPAQALQCLQSFWRPRLEAILRRLERREELRRQLEQVLRRLGDSAGVCPPWRRCPKRSHDERYDSPYAHGLPDLLTLWDFSQELGHAREEYEEAGR